MITLVMIKMCPSSDAAQDDGKDDQCTYPFLRHGRYAGREEQDEDNGALALVEEESLRGRSLPGLQRVGSKLRQTLPGIDCGDPVGRAVKRLCQTIRWLALVLVRHGSTVCYRRPTTIITTPH